MNIQEPKALRCPVHVSTASIGDGYSRFFFQVLGAWLHGDGHVLPDGAMASNELKVAFRHPSKQKRYREGCIYNSRCAYLE